MPFPGLRLRVVLDGPLPWVVGGYFAVFLVLDWVSFIRPLEGLNITPWNPQPALAVALLVASPGLWWLVLLALLAAEVLVRGASGDAFTLVAVASALTLSYAALARGVRALMGAQARLAGGRGVAALMLAMAAGSLVNGLVYVGIYAAAGYLPSGPAWLALARYWVGDAVGLTVTLPILLLAMNPAGRARLRRVITHPQSGLITALIVALLWLLFGGGTRAFDFSYLLLLPIIWASMKFGVPGAVLACALTQVGLIAAVHTAGPLDLHVFETQLLLVAITITGLALGVVVDERARIDAELQRSLRMAAAGQMTAALAHELGQPLNALTLYAQAAELLAANTAVAPASDPSTPQLVDTVKRMATEARRAGDVVRRLRDFFRAGSTQLQATALGPMLEEALARQQERAAALGVTLVSSPPGPGVELWVDPVQMQVVLRNLLGNALDAVTADGASPARRVTLTAHVRAGEVQLEVEDSGPGLDASAADAVFEVEGSTKVGGMGIGLGICRAIIEAHGGRLWAVAARHGHFCLTLPLGRGTDRDVEPHAP